MAIVLCRIIFVIFIVSNPRSPPPKITGSITETISALTYLTTLNFRLHDVWGSLPSSMNAMPNLTVIDFYGNALTGQVWSKQNTKHIFYSGLSSFLSSGSIASLLPMNAFSL